MICGRCGGELYYWGDWARVEWFVCRRCGASTMEEDLYVWYPEGDVFEWNPDTTTAKSRRRKKWLIK